MNSNDRNEQRKRWAEAHPELVAKHSMKRRMASHDYYGVAVYMVTLCVESRLPLLGTLCGNDDYHVLPWIKLTELGRQVKQAWLNIPKYHPEVKLIAFQPMPDHIHGILHVTRPMSCHLGRVIHGFKKGCNDALRSLSTPGDTPTTLWEEGYNDRILHGAGQLQRWINYLIDNPRRLWVKRNNPELFIRHTGITIGGTPVTTMGNRFLLDYPEKVNVKCSRSLTQSDIESLCQRLLTQASRGAVLVSPCISPGEKEIMARAFEAGFPIIILIENGFAPMQKPSGRQFEACAQGRLLIIAPWPHHDDNRRITRAQCEFLNDLARFISLDDWHAT